MSAKLTQTYKLKILTVLGLLVSGIFASAQNFEVGAWAGGANYFGDLNTNSNFSMVRPAGGIFLRNNFNTRWVLKNSFSFGQIAFDDKKSPNAFNRQRNLHFRSNIGELSSMIELNFLEFDKTKPNKWFSPFFSVGFAVLYFNPQAELNGQWYYLQPLGTEGQNDPSFSGVDKYRLVSFAIPVGGGFKFSINRNWNIGIFGEIRVTFTDYLDDVSGAYPSALSLPEGTRGVAYQLYDRSPEVGERIGVPGRQRGSTTTNDFYLFGGVTVSYTFFKLKCPTPGDFKRFSGN